MSIKKISCNEQHDFVWISTYSAGTKSHPVSSSRAPTLVFSLLCYLFVLGTYFDTLGESIIQYSC